MKYSEFIAEKATTPAEKLLKKNKVKIDKIGTQDLGGPNDAFMTTVYTYHFKSEDEANKALELITKEFGDNYDILLKTKKSVEMSMED